MAKDTKSLLQDPALRDAPDVEGFKVLEPAVLYDKVGRGGMGTVYRGRHFSLECDVAIKVLKPDLAQDKAFVARFEREARLAAQINHQNVVRVMDVKRRNGVHYLVMEFIKGETARERVFRKGPLSERESLNILAGAATGLGEAHTRGIIHRDIKPDNILISAAGEVKLADLGLAKANQPGADQSLSMLSSGVMGTPQYMPPEQWQTPNVTPAADVWALGALLYFLISGRNAIRSGELLAVADRIRSQDFPSLREVRSDLRPEVVDLCARCTRREASERFANARELMRALRPLIANDDSDELLSDAETGTGIVRAAMVTPPPRATLARIRFQVGTEVPEGEATDAAPASQPTPAHEPTQDLQSPQAGSTVGGDDSGQQINTTPLPVSAELIAASRPEIAAEPDLPVDRQRTRLLAACCVLLVIAVAVLVTFSSGSESGKPPRKEGPPVTATLPKQQPSTPVAIHAVGTKTEDNKALAAAAYERGMSALPIESTLGTAIDHLEEALRLDPSHQEARAKLLLALKTRIRRLEDKQPREALAAARRARELNPDDAKLQALADTLRDKLQQRLLGGFELRTPRSGTVLLEAKVPVAGRMVAEQFAVLRMALDTREDAAKLPFPGEQAQEIQVVAGEFLSSLAPSGNGLHTLRTEIEDSDGIRVEAPPRTIIVNTEAPMLTVATPKAGALVAGTFWIRGRLSHPTPVALTIDGVAVEQDPDGSWQLQVERAGGMRALQIVATDSSDRQTTQDLRLNVDSFAPRLSLTSKELATREDKLAVSGRLSDQSPCTMTLDGQAIELGEGNAFDLELALPREGQHTFELVATDRVGNTSRRSIVAQRDTQPPQLAWVAPPQEVPAGPFEVRGTVDDATLDSLEVLVNGKPAIRDGRNWKATVQVAGQGSLAVKVQAQDRLGNAAQPLETTLRGLLNLATVAWGQAAPDARAVPIGRESYPSVVIEKRSGMRMVLVPAGSFMMGSATSEAGRDADERQHARTIRKPFYLGETEVTQAQWQSVMDDNPSSTVSPSLPVDRVSWVQARRFAIRLNRAGTKFRLPSEAEWEYACRAGTTSTFATGATLDLEDVRAGAHPFDLKAGEASGPVRAGSLPPNAFGLQEMHGNVWEWCRDPIKAYPKRGTESAATGRGMRIVRGGSWRSEAEACRSANRHACRESLAMRGVGFRLAISL